MSKGRHLYFADDHWLQLKKQAKIRGVGVGRFIMTMYHEWLTSFSGFHGRTKQRLIHLSKLRFGGSVDNLINASLDLYERENPITEEDYAKAFENGYRNTD